MNSYNEWCKKLSSLGPPIFVGETVMKEVVTKNEGMIETRGAMSWERRGKKSDAMIAKVRRELGINQAEFAVLCGIGCALMVSQYETGRTLPKLEVVMRVIEVARKSNIDITLEDFEGKYRG